MFCVSASLSLDDMMDLVAGRLARLEEGGKSVRLLSVLILTCAACVLFAQEPLNNEGVVNW